MNDLTGKTIDRVEERHDLGYGTTRVWFTDGTCADLKPTGWEADGIDIEYLDADALEKQRIEIAQATSRIVVERERAAAERERILAGPPSLAKSVIVELDDAHKALQCDINRQMF